MICLKCGGTTGGKVMVGRHPCGCARDLEANKDLNKAETARRYPPAPPKMVCLEDKLTPTGGDDTEPIRAVLGRVTGGGFGAQKTTSLRIPSGGTRLVDPTGVTIVNKPTKSYRDRLRTEIKDPKWTEDQLYVLQLCLKWYEIDMKAASSRGGASRSPKKVASSRANGLARKKP